MSDAYIPGPASPASFGGFTPTSPFSATSTETRLQSLVGSLDPTNLLPPGARTALSAGDVPTPRVSKTFPSALQTLQNKYTDLAPLINALPPEARNALLNLDADRVSRGGRPLTTEETLGALQTYLTQEPATPQGGRSPLNIPGNVLSDLGMIVKSIPQIPAALVEEATSLGQLGEGSNVVSQIANAPGVRMIPGSYIVGNLAEGDIEELATHPLFTALDALPAASAAAKGTAVGRAATEVATAAGRNPRPLAAFLTQKLDDQGQIVDRAGRAAVKQVRDQTRIGQILDQTFGGRARDTMREFDLARMQVINMMNGLEDGDAVVRATQRAASLNDRFKAEHGWDQVKIGEVTTKMKMGDLSKFDPVELAYRNEFNEITDTIGRELNAEGALGMFDGEMYTVEQADALHAEQRRAAHYQSAVALRTEWKAPSGRFQPDDFREFLDDALNRHPAGDPRPTLFMKAELHHLVNTLDRYGYDVTKARGTLASASKKGATVPMSEVADEIRRLLDDTDPTTLRPLPSPSALAEVLKRVGGHDLQARLLQQAIAKGDTPEITRRLNNLARRQSRYPELTPEYMADVRRWRSIYQADMKYGRPYTRKNADLARSRFENAYTNTPPARFGDVIGDRTRRGIDATMPDPTRPGVWRRQNIRGANETFLDMEAKALGRPLTADEAAELTRAIAEDRWGAFTFADRQTVAEMYRGIENDVRKTWRWMRSQGVEPSFIHVTSRTRSYATLHPKPGPVPVGLSQTQERLIDMAPGVNDAGLAVSHQGMEILSRRASEEALERVLTKHGIAEWELRELYADRARDFVETNQGTWGFKGELKQLIERTHVPVNLKDLGFDWKSARLDKFNQERIYIPRALHDAMGDLMRPKELLGGVFDPITKLFRIAVVGLSPRTHLYNIVGGVTMVMGETGPGAFRFLGDAIKMVRDPATIGSVELRRIIGSQRTIMRDFDDLSNLNDRVRRARAIANVNGGRTLGRLWEQLQRSRVREFGGKVVEKSFDLNAFFDDTYRTMAYLYGYDRAITKGLSKEVAERAGLETLQKVMMDWSGLTPLERSVMKSIFPFYSFMNHAIRYVARYPVDHPLRAGVLAAFARAEEEDLNDVLPDRFLSSFFIGDMDDEGRQNALNLGPINPFGDVANMLTFAGFLSATNPAIATVLESVGLVRGQGELYPSLRYNPDTGRLEGTRVNPLLSAVQNTIPQSQLVFTLMGVNTDLAERIKRDPEGASRSLLSAGGLPVLWREFDVVGEQFKAELARQDSQTNVLNAALKSGNWQSANRYPGLQGIQEKVQGLPPELLQFYTPTEQEAIRAQLEALLATQQPIAQPPDGLEQLMDGYLAPNPIALQRAIGGI